MGRLSYTIGERESKGWPTQEVVASLEMTVPFKRVSNAGRVGGVVDVGREVVRGGVVGASEGVVGASEGFVGASEGFVGASVGFVGASDGVVGASDTEGGDVAIVMSVNGDWVGGIVVGVDVGDMVPG